MKFAFACQGRLVYLMISGPISWSRNGHKGFQKCSLDEKICHCYYYHVIIVINFYHDYYYVLALSSLFSTRIEAQPRSAWTSCLAHDDMLPSPARRQRLPSCCDQSSLPRFHLRTPRQRRNNNVNVSWNMNSDEFENQQVTGMMKLDIESKHAAMAASAFLWKASASSERPRSWRLNEWCKWQTVT